MTFLKTIMASCLGVILAGFALFGILFVIGTSLASSAMSKKSVVKANSVLKLTLKDPIPELTGNSESTEGFQLETDKVVGLHDLIAALRHAKEDDKIKGLLLDISAVGTGRAGASNLREAIIDFKESGKFVYAHSTYYTQGTYYLASVADKVYVHPLGGVDFLGFAATVPFLKDMLDRLEIDMQVFYAGQFKSATEPYRRYNMSEQAKLQTRAYLEGLYKIYLNDISESRGISTQQLSEIADNYLLRNADDAVNYKMVDGKMYWDEILTLLRDDLGLDEDDKISSTSLRSYARDHVSKTDFTIKDRIAVVYMEGTIVDGQGDVGSVGGDKYAKIIRKLRQDDKVKAIVVRVNSGGGSGLASDIMWRELELAKAAGKPYVASMGDVAASGGYYVACNADTIYAEPNTITGSIGVFAMIPSLEDMLKSKVGITFDTVKTGPFSHGLTPLFDISPEEGKILQSAVEEFYEIFLKRVADGRGMTRDQAHEIAQGRVWTGEKALEIKLVDAMGGLDEALATAANLAGLTQYRVAEYPKIKDQFERILDELQNKDQASFTQNAVQSELKKVFPYFDYVQEIMQTKGVQARLPFVIEPM